MIILQAGQATEPETMIPIGLIAGTDGQVSCLLYTYHTSNAHWLKPCHVICEALVNVSFHGVPIIPYSPQYKSIFVYSLQDIL